MCLGLKTDQETPSEAKLTHKQRLFAEAYLANNGNATKAAIAAGYSEKMAYSIGHENTKKHEIREYLRQRYAEAAMGADEVLGRLSDQARGAGYYIQTEFGLTKIDLEGMQRDGKMHLVKGIKYSERWQMIDEFNDALSAL